MSRKKPNTSDIIAFMGPDTEFVGKLFFEGSVRLDGKFKGEILSPGVLVVGESADVEAEVNVGTVVVSGKVQGNINAKNQAVLHFPGRVVGNIVSPSVVIDEGVVFEGRCRMLDLEPVEGGRAKKITYISSDNSGSTGA